MGKIPDYPAKSTPVDADLFVIEDVGAGATKKTTKANVTKTISTDTITEQTADNGTTIEGINHKDNVLSGVKNPYKFSAYATSSHTYGISDTKVTFEAEEFDTNNNFDLTTDTYTAPVNGFYVFISGNLIDNASTSTGNILHLYVNGASAKILKRIGSPFDSTTLEGSALIKLTAGDTVNIYIGSSAHSIATLGDRNSDYFMGYLISDT